VISLIAGALSLSVGYVVVGVYTLYAYKGRGVRALGSFAILWGTGNGITNATDLYLHAHFGITTPQQLSAIEFSQQFGFVLAVGTALSLLLTTVAPFVWVAFVLNYTTQLQPRHRKLYAGVVVIVTGFVLLFTGPSVLQVLGFEFGIANTFLFLTGLVVVGSQIGVAGAGVAQMYKASQRHQQFGTVEGLAVAMPLLVLFNNAANNFGLYSHYLSIYSVFLSLHLVGLAGFVAATERYGLLEQLPVANTVARDTAIDTVDVGIIVLDNEDRVADLNGTAKSLLGAESDPKIGLPYQRLHPSFVDTDLPAEGRRTIDFPETGQVIEADTTITTDRYDRPLGAAIALYDITDKKRREERIQVLNRVLRHNLRNELTGAKGYTRLLATTPDDASELASQVDTHLDELLEIGSKAQQIEQMLEADRDIPEPAPLRKVATDSIATVRSDADSELSPEQVTVSIPEKYSLSVNPAILKAVLTELIENAVQHGDHPEIEVEFREADNAIVVTDTGPGIPEIEIEVLEVEEETPLKHGQGLGLWLIKWGVDRLGGTIDIETSDAGTEVMIELPAAHLTTD
jgi:signal transduction histidine kinase